MFVLILSLVIGSSIVVYEIGQQFHVGDEWWGLAIYFLGIGLASILNLSQYIQMVRLSLDRD
jgi:hypothetical protein